VVLVLRFLDIRNFPVYQCAKVTRTKKSKDGGNVHLSSIGTSCPRNFLDCSLSELGRYAGECAPWSARPIPQTRRELGSMTYYFLRIFPRNRIFRRFGLDLLPSAWVVEKPQRE